MVSYDFLTNIQTLLRRYTLLRHLNEDEEIFMELCRVMQKLSVLENGVSAPCKVQMGQFNNVKNTAVELKIYLTAYDEMMTDIHSQALTSIIINHEEENGCIEYFQDGSDDDDQDNESTTDTYVPRVLPPVICRKIEAREKIYQKIVHLRNQILNDNKEIIHALIARFNSLKQLLSELPEIGPDDELVRGQETSSFIGAEADASIKTIAQAAMEEVEEWKRQTRMVEVQGETDKYLSDLSAVDIFDPEMDPTHTVELIKKLFNSIEQEEKWKNQIQIDFELPLDALQDFLSSIYKILLNESEDLSIVIAALKKSVTLLDSRPNQFPLHDGIGNLMKLREEENELKFKFDMAQVEERHARTKAQRREVSSKVEKFRLEYRRATKTVEREINRLLTLNVSFPEFSLMYPQANLLRISQLAKTGLLKYGISFNPSDQNSCFTDIQRIAVGRHAVYKAKLDGSYHVLKEYQLQARSESKKILAEASKLQDLNHPAIASIDGVILGSNSEEDGTSRMNAYIQMPYYEGGNLLSWLRNGQRGKEELRAIFHELMRGIEYMHSNGIVHCDIKLENVFMTSNNSFASLKLGDFDISKNLDSNLTDTTTTMVGGTNIYLSPERVANERAIEKSDIYAAAVMMFLAHADDRDRLISRLVQMPIREVAVALELEVGNWDTDTEPRNLILSMLHQHPERRPSASQILQSPYLNIPTAVLELNQKEAEEREARQKYMEMNPEKECVLCMEEKRLFDGLCCSNAEKKHFTCNACFSDYVAHETSIENIESFRRDDGNIVCPVKNFGCPGTRFADKIVAMHVNEETFARFMGGKEKVIEQLKSAEIEESSKMRYESELQKLREMSEEQRNVELKRLRIEEMLNIKCPECKKEFYEIEVGDCMAARCSSCHAAFCGWCLHNCKYEDNDAHNHVRRCPFKPEGADAFFDTSPGRRDWWKITRDRQAREITEEMRKCSQQELLRLLEVVLPLLLSSNTFDRVRENGSGENGWCDHFDNAKENLRVESGVPQY